MCKKVGIYLNNCERDVVLKKSKFVYELLSYYVGRYYTLPDVRTFPFGDNDISENKSPTF